MRKQAISNVLAVLGCVGVVASNILVAKASFKAANLINTVDDTNKKLDNDQMTTSDKVKLCWRYYIPAAGLCMSTILCILGSNAISRSTQASLIGAYTMLDSSYKKYRKKIRERYGTDVDNEVVTDASEDSCPNHRRPKEKDELFFDFATCQYFRAPMRDVLQKVKMDGGMECYIIATPFDTCDGSLT